MIMNRSTFIRVILGFTLLIGVYLFPYWFVIAAAGVVAIFIPYYVEFIAIIVIEEMLYHGAGLASTNLLYPAALVGLFLVLEAGRNLTRERFLRI